MQTLNLVDSRAICAVHSYRNATPPLADCFWDFGGGVCDAVYRDKTPKLLDTQLYTPSIE